MDNNCNITKKQRKVVKNTQTQRKKIGTLVLKNRQKIKKHFLQSICSNSGVCLAFGLESENIVQYFQGFVHFQYLTPPIQTIHASSSNGYIIELTYERDHYTASAILKSSLAATADNLFYEYLVGLFLNQQSKLYPCFLETYGLFRFKSERAWSNIKDIRGQISPKVLSKAVTLLSSSSSSLTNAQMNTLLRQSCTKSKHQAILIQHLSRVRTLSNKLDECHRQKTLADFYQSQLVSILFQVYYPLMQLQNIFTHYDLHSSNIMLYKPGDDMYVTFHYHLPNSLEIVQFKSKYVVKIIDYGRSYIKDSLNIFEKLCKLKACKPECGKNYGFDLLNPENSFKDEHIISTKQNSSVDLRLLHSLLDELPPPLQRLQQSPPPLYAFLDKVIFHHDYGTTPNPRSHYPTHIANVQDAFHGIKDILNTRAYLQSNDAFYQTKQKMGDLYIYSDGSPLQYVAAK